MVRYIYSINIYVYIYTAYVLKMILYIRIYSVYIAFEYTLYIYYGPFKYMQSIYSTKIPISMCDHSQVFLTVSDNKSYFKTFVFLIS